MRRRGGRSEGEEDGRRERERESNGRKKDGKGR